MSKSFGYLWYTLYIYIYIYTVKPPNLYTPIVCTLPKFVHFWVTPANVIEIYISRYSIIVVYTSEFCNLYTWARYKR